MLRAGQNWHSLVIIISSAMSLVKYQLYIKIPPMFAAASYVTLNSNNINMLQFITTNTINNRHAPGVGTRTAPTRAENQ